MRKGKFVVYTAITKGYDILRPPPQSWLGKVEFVAFMDEPVPTPGWEIRPLHREFKDPCRNAKIHKILAHTYFPSAEYSLWIDGCVHLKPQTSPAQWVAEYLKDHDIALCKHHERNCIYQEGGVCLKYGLDDPKTVNRQMQRYYEEGYPANHGLVECTVIFRRHSEPVEALNELWYREISQGSRRDQLSFNYAAHKTGVAYAHLAGTIINNPHFRWYRHTRAPSRPLKGRDSKPGRAAGK